MSGMFNFESLNQRANVYLDIRDVLSLWILSFSVDLIQQSK